MWQLDTLVGGRQPGWGQTSAVHENMTQDATAMVPANSVTTACREFLRHRERPRGGLRSRSRPLAPDIVREDRDDLLP